MNNSASNHDDVYICIYISSILYPKTNKRVASFCSGGIWVFHCRASIPFSVDFLVIDEFHSAYIDIKRYAYCNLKVVFKLLWVSIMGRRSISSIGVDCYILLVSILLLKVGFERDYVSNFTWRKYLHR